MRFGGTMFAIFTAGTMLQAQPQNAPDQKFEVASIKLHRMPPGTRTFQLPGSDPIRISGNRVDIQIISLSGLVVAAYGVKPYQVSGGPSWAGERGDLWDVSAKAEGDSVLDAEHARLMLRALLAERFQLKLRREPKELPVYNLAIAKGGLKMKEIAPEATPSPGARKGTIEQITGLISGVLDRPLLDKTGLTGAYEFRWDFAELVRERAAADTVERVSIALTSIKESLGLQADPGKAAVDTFVIDSAEKPSDN